MQFPTTIPFKAVVLLVLCTQAGCVATGIAASPVGDSCHPDFDKDAPQYIVGYGSLMETASKKRSSPTAGPNIPVRVKGFAREWNTRGNTVGFSTTFLGVKTDANAHIVATVYRDPNPGDIKGTDGRETYYCRVAVPESNIELLVDDFVFPPDSHVWIYVNKPDSTFPPDARWPIVQSYVDIFMNGCLELNERTANPDFDLVEACITTTRGWSKHWVNDRLYPRRAFIYEPNASKIDGYLNRLLPEEFGAIVIE
ncbi:MAG: hypothetical protein QNJ40_05335 [Xanthomonadales bacterium]|nr:hypothetical protein [Xanthomonadales bacterium]